MMNKPLLLLPGMMCDARLFEPQIIELSKTRPVMVMPLIGRSTIGDLADDILKNAPPKFHLLGLSMGGIVAMEIIRKAPERISRLALFDTTPLADSAERIAQREEEIRRVELGELRAIMRDDMKPNYLAQSKNKQAILDLCMEMAESHGPELFIQQSKALKTRLDQCETLKKVNVPTLIACGEYDSLCPLGKHQLMHKLTAESALQVIPGAGHLPTLEQPELTNRVIANWLAS